VTRAPVEPLERAITRVFLGKPRVVRLVLTGFFAQGHMLLEDVPGVGKTLLAQALSRAIHGQFKRIQFTPDLLPSDLLGTSVYNQKNGTFDFKPGPVFANVVLADEINRTTPRTQSALLEAMNASSVSFDGVTHPLPEPFLVLATQNPYEFEGTYPLPESQLDRFLMRIDIGYPSREDEKRMLVEQQERHPLLDVVPVVATEQVLAMQTEVRRVKIEDSLRDYLLSIVAATRRHRRVRVGVSPRGSVSLQRAAQAHAWLEGRDFVVPDDIKALAVPVLAHRLVLESASFEPSSFAESERVLTEILEGLEVPL